MRVIVITPGCRIDKGNTHGLLLLIVTQQEWEKQIEQAVKKQIETWYCQLGNRAEHCAKIAA